MGENEIGRWLGVAHNVGHAMIYYILTKAGKVIARSTVAAIPQFELKNPELQQKCNEYDEAIKDLLKDERNMIAPEDHAGGNMPSDWEQLDPIDDPVFAEEFKMSISDDTIPEADDYTPDTIGDPYVGVEIALPRTDDPEWKYARLKSWKRNAEGVPEGTAHKNLVLDTRLYEVEFKDGHTESMAANLIAECMFAQVDKEGNRHVIMDQSIDHRREGGALNQAEAFVDHRQEF